MDSSGLSMSVRTSVLSSPPHLSDISDTLTPISACSFEAYTHQDPTTHTHPNTQTPNSPCLTNRSITESSTTPDNVCTYTAGLPPLAPSSPLLPLDSPLSRYGSVRNCDSWHEAYVDVGNHGKEGMEGMERCTAERKMDSAKDSTPPTAVGQHHEEWLSLGRAMVGRWETVLSLSDPLEPLFKRIGVGYIKRAIVDRLAILLTVTVNEQHNNDGQGDSQPSLHATVHLPFGSRQMVWTLDGSVTVEHDPDCGTWEGYTRTADVTLPIEAVLTDSGKVLHVRGGGCQGGGEEGCRDEGTCPHSWAHHDARQQLSTGCKEGCCYKARKSCSVKGGSSSSSCINSSPCNSSSSSNNSMRSNSRSSNSRSSNSRSSNSRSSNSRSSNSRSSNSRPASVRRVTIDHNTNSESSCSHTSRRRCDTMNMPSCVGHEPVKCDRCCMSRACCTACGDGSMTKIRALQQVRRHRTFGVIHETRAVLADKQHGRILYLDYELYPQDDPDNGIRVVRILKPV
eukprot:GHVQ01019466.1.p1 GENE.GHVQ01019466.1~~GHVQ01019466.1.p1  ORF type:complete len:591 (-),score=158.34 GHVQ01019466.1:1168-2697(-)